MNHLNFSFIFLTNHLYFDLNQINNLKKLDFSNFIECNIEMYIYYER